MGLTMAVNVAALRFQIETALAGRIPAPFAPRPVQVETAPFRIAEVDALTGGLPRGGLTEICGPPCSGRATLLLSALASGTAHAEACALVDGRDSFDPHSAAAAGVKLERLLWVRCGNIDQCLRATDLLLQGGGFGLIALDLSVLPAKTVRYVPLNVWFRFRRAVEHKSTILLLVDRESNAGTCASLVLRLASEPARWAEPPAQRAALTANSCACLLDGAQIQAQLVRSRLQTAAGARPGALQERSFAGKQDAGPAASFRTKTEWSCGKEIAKTK
jgi:recombination protein RecA